MSRPAWVSRLCRGSPSTKQDAALTTIKARHLFPPDISYVWVHRHLYLRGYAFEFIRMLSATWTRAMINRFMRSDETADVALAIDPTAGFLTPPEVK